MDQKLYRGMIGSLLYLIDSHLDIMHNVCFCAKFQSYPKETHLIVVKGIMKYLKGTKTLGLWYLGGSNISLTGYSCFDFGRSKVVRKSTSGTCQLLGCSLITWHLKKQAWMALSTTKA